MPEAHWLCCVDPWYPKVDGSISTDLDSPHHELSSCISSILLWFSASCHVRCCCGGGGSKLVVATFVEDEPEGRSETGESEVLDGAWVEAELAPRVRESRGLCGFSFPIFLSPSHCLTATSSSSPWIPSATKSAIFAHLSDSMRALDLFLPFSFPFLFSPWSVSILSLAKAFAPGRNRQSGYMARCWAWAATASASHFSRSLGESFFHEWPLSSQHVIRNWLKVEQWVRMYRWFWIVNCVSPQPCPRLFGPWWMRNEREWTRLKDVECKRGLDAFHDSLYVTFVNN